MFFNKQQERPKRQTRQPDQVGALSDVTGIALWASPDGNHDIKIGTTITVPNRPLIVKACYKLSDIRAVVSGLQTVASVFSNEQSVPESIRQDLRSLAEALDAALTVSVADELNGVSVNGGTALPFGASA